MITANGNKHAPVIDDDPMTHELAERVQGTSPTPRSAAYPSDIELVGRSQAFVDTMNQVDIVSRTDSSVLLTGEPSAGPELLAAAIHQRSERSAQPFVVINCAAIPAELIEAKLFGQVQNASDDVHEDRRGLFEQADGGTVFLDEIAQTSPSFQLKLLRVMQTGEMSRVGSSDIQRVDVRVIAGSSCSLEQEVETGRFSRDLFNMLKAVSIFLPALPDHHEHLSLETSLSEHANNDWVTLSEIEGRYVGRVLEHTRGNKQAAARVLSVDRKTLDRMIKRHNIDCQRARALRAKVSARGAS
jgi:transcriptional regulator with GAF, ATPase, and Fis domain